MVYYLVSYFYNIFIGKQIIFSPLIGIPMTLIFWPQYVYADLINIDLLGLTLETVLGLFSIIVFIVVFVVRDLSLKKRQ